jgi:hypothetical protein
MRSLPCLGLLALLGLAGAAKPASAQVSINAPFVQVRIGDGVYVRAPFVRVYVPTRPVRRARPVRAVPRQRVVPEGPPPVPVEELRTYPVVPPVARPMTPQQFAAAFEPRPGAYEVVLEHPRTHRPVTVRFTLPEGAPRKVRANRLKLEFDYGRYRVTIRFFHNGTVRVRS